MKNYYTPNSNTPPSSPRRRLAARGILHAATKASWRESRNAWHYPVFSLEGATLAQRAKAYDSNATPKYWWPNGKPDGCDYYLFPDILEAIHNGSGQIYIVSGEPDVLTMKSANLHNVLAWFGETSIPKDLGEFLALTLDVTHVIHYIDLDQTGRKSAQKTAAQLSGTGITYEVHQPPHYLGEKGDLNKLWQFHTFDQESFHRALVEDTTPLDIHIPPPTPTPPPSQTSDDMPSDYYAAIEAGLDVREYKTNGWSKAVRCPLRNHRHDDKRPAAYWHEDMHILNCFKCGETYLAKDVAAALGIRWEDFIEQKPQQPTTDSSPEGIPPEELRYFPHGLPDELREYLLRLNRLGNFLDHANAAWVLDLRQELIELEYLTPDETFTVNTLVNGAKLIGRATRYKCILRGLTQLHELGFVAIKRHEHRTTQGRPADIYAARPLGKALHRFRQVLHYRLREYVFQHTIADIVTADWFPDLPPDIAQEIAAFENSHRQEIYDEQREKRGHAEKQMEHFAELIEYRFALSRLLIQPSTRLLEWEVCKNGSDYRVLLLKSLVAAAGDGGRTITRAKAAWQIGVSTKTLTNVRARAGIIAVPQYKYYDLPKAENTLEHINTAAPWAADREYGRYLESSDGHTVRVRPHDPNALSAWAQDKLDEGYEIKIKIQTASLERLATPEEHTTIHKRYEERMERQKANARKRRALSQAHKTPPTTGEQSAEETSKPPPAETVPATFTLSYVHNQLALVPHNSSKIPKHLMPYLQPYTTLKSYMGGRYGNNDPPLAT